MAAAGEIWFGAWKLHFLALFAYLNVRKTTSLSVQAGYKLQ